jgi:hypothetical protein
LATHRGQSIIEEAARREYPLRTLIAAVALNPGDLCEIIKNAN